jgi:malonyl CoA-acyl carrier protein transacylase
MTFWHLDIPVFAGQGTDAANSAHTLQQALRDTASPSGSVLLSACFDSFHDELSCLSPIELEESELERADFLNAKDILSTFPDKYIHNPIISGTKLFLIQSLRYLAHVETSSDSPSRFLDALKLNVSSNLGILGLSSGMLPACVVAASNSTLAYISHSVEAFRLAFWIGVRAQGYRRRCLQAGEGHLVGLPWSVILLGMDKQCALDAIDEFNQKVRSEGLSEIF